MKQEIVLIVLTRNEHNLLRDFISLMASEYLEGRSEGDHGHHPFEVERINKVIHKLRNNIYTKN